ncbi:NAD(+)--rifampin ADP-ribosyltransferase [Agrobacterium pusense]
MEAVLWGVELAAGEGPERIHVAEPTGAWLDDPNVTN